MSAHTLTRIYDETAARLWRARSDDEIRAVGLDHAAKVGADLAEVMFLRIRELAPLTNPEINSMILQGAERVALSVTEAFEAQNLPEESERDAYGNAALGGYLDRMEVLLSAPETGGAA